MVEDSLDVAMLRDSADGVRSVAATAWIPPELRDRMRRLATELTVATADLVEAEAHRRLAVTR